MRQTKKNVRTNVFLSNEFTAVFSIVKVHVNEIEIPSIKKREYILCK